MTVISVGCNSIQYSALSMAIPSAPKEEQISPASKLSLSSIDQMQGGCLSLFFLASKEGYAFQIPINSSFLSDLPYKVGMSGMSGMLINLIPTFSAR